MKEKLTQLFDQKFDCYASYEDAAGVIHTEPAISKAKFVEVVSGLISKLTTDIRPTILKADLNTIGTKDQHVVICIGDSGIPMIAKEWEAFVKAYEEAHPAPEAFPDISDEYLHKLKLVEPKDIQCFLAEEEKKENFKKKTLGQRGIPDPNQRRFRNRQNRK